jgi:hypothetical protein
VSFTFWSLSDSDAKIAFLLVAVSGSSFAGFRTGAGPENSFVELLFLPLESNGRVGFCLKIGCSIGESFGDS